jgi:hypothetical protein
VAQRRQCSNDREAPVAGDEVPGLLQLEEGKGECKARLQWGTMAAWPELTERMGQRRRCGQNLAAQGISGGPEWVESRGDGRGAVCVAEGKEMGGEKAGADILYQHAEVRDG